MRTCAWLRGVPLFHAWDRVQFLHSYSLHVSVTRLPPECEADQKKGNATGVGFHQVVGVDLLVWPGGGSVSNVR